LKETGDFSQISPYKIEPQEEGEKKRCEIPAFKYL
jgi:hypothetical protein